MKSAIILGSLFFLAVISLTNHSEAYQTTFGDGVFIFVQTTVRDSNGNLITYLESSKFTDLNLEYLETFLDFEASRANDPIVDINGEEYQVIRRVQSKTFTNDDLVASTILSQAEDGEIIQIARFAHDGYPVTNGDTLQSVWTFVRPVS